MATLHVNKYPLHRDLFGISVEEVEGKFDGWQQRAIYTVQVTIVLQIDTTNVSPGEKQIAPNITFLATNRAIINIYRIWTTQPMSFSEFQNYYAQREMALERYVENLLSRLNTVRARAKLIGSWYINYGLNDRKIEVKPA